MPSKILQSEQFCGASIKGKQSKSSFKPKGMVSTTKPLEMLHIDLCGPLRVISRGGKRYILVIFDDYSRFTWTLFLTTKDETYEVFEIFVTLVQKKLNTEVINIILDHG